MDLEGIMVNEISQTEKDRYCMISPICKIKTKQNLKLIDTENRLVAARGGGWRVEEMDGLFLFLV